MKFKVGDKVRATREGLAKQAESSFVKSYEISWWTIKKIAGDAIYCPNNEYRYEEKYLELVPEEPEFEYGEEIEVRDFTDRKWRKGIFVCKIPWPVSYKFLIVNPHQEKEFREWLEFTTINWKYARKRKNELKRSAVAKKFWVSEDFTLVD